MSLKLEWNYRKQIDLIMKFARRINIIHIFLIVLALHLFIMSTPSDGGMIFDESHYIPAARDTVHFIAANAEHTPLSKLVIGWSIQVFGDWWFGWRITPIIFSSLSIVFIYLIAREFMEKKYALFAASFAALDVLLFVNGSIAILDPQALFFALAGVYFFKKKKWSYSAIAFGVAVLSKEIAVTILLGMVFYLLLSKIKLRFRFKVSKPKFSTFKPLLIFSVLFFLIVLGGIQAYDTIYKPSSSAVLVTGVTANVVVDQNQSAITTVYSTSNMTNQVYITNPIQHLIFAFKYYSGLTPTINPLPKDFRPPWSWVLPIENAWNPPQYFGVSVSSGGPSKSIVSYLSQISYPITVFLVPALALGLYFVYKRKNMDFPFFMIGWVAATYVPWLLFGAFVQHMTFNYYFMYTAPVCSIAASWFFANLKIKSEWRLYLLASLLLVVGAYFLYYFPINLFRA